MSKKKLKKLFLLVRYQRQNATYDAITSLLSICYVNTILFSLVFIIYAPRIGIPASETVTYCRKVYFRTFSWLAFCRNRLTEPFVALAMIFCYVRVTYPRTNGKIQL